MIEQKVCHLLIEICGVIVVIRKNKNESDNFVIDNRYGIC